LARAHRIFEANEPRGLFYRAATELVELAQAGRTSLSVADAIAVLLQTWNRAFYQYRPFSEQHFRDIEALVNRHDRALRDLGPRSISSVSSPDLETIADVFDDFERTLWPVGAAKSLHLLAPRLFPLWDRAIAKAYGVALRRVGTNAERYCQFLQITKAQCERLADKVPAGVNILKALDEYNYCRFTRPRWWLDQA
jgi:hypothetical protein